MKHAQAQKATGLAGFGVCIALCSSLVFSQIAHQEWETHDVNKRLNSNTRDQVLRAEGAESIKINFGRAKLGKYSYIEVTSLEDGATQTFDAETLRDANNASAYFNGDAVRVRLHQAAGEATTRVDIDSIDIPGEDRGQLESQCGSRDDRVPSNDAAVGRVMPVGCTGWIIDNKKILTAGHCISSRSTSIQFNVPQSASNGAKRNPGPEDQYTIIQSSIVHKNTKIGDDWAVFEVQKNSQTGLHPIDKQGKSYKLVRETRPGDIRITGFGSDTGSRNQTQQTHTGKFVSLSGTRLRYSVDTTGGNSGSPVIDLATGNAIGIHTNAGCGINGGSNSGTSTLNDAFWAAADVNGNGKPNVSFASPNGNPNLDLGYTSLYIKVNASDSDGIANVRLYINGNFVRQENFAPYEFGHDKFASETTGLGQGSHTFKVVAEDKAGSTNEAKFTLTVKQAGGGSGGGNGNCHDYSGSDRKELNLSTKSCVNVSGGLNGKTLQVWDSDTNKSCDFRGTVKSSDGNGSLSINKNYVTGGGFTGGALTFSSSNNCNFVKMRLY